MKKYLFDFKNVYNVTGIIRWSIIVNIILLVVDKNNILSKVISFGFNKEIYILMGIFILVSLFDFGLLNSLKIKIVNDIDMILIFSIIILFTFSVISLLTFKEVTYRVYVSIIFIFILAVLLIYRITSFNKLIKALDKKSNIYSLKDLYDGCITENNEFILVSEEYVDYDLLDRDRFINNLYNIITNCNPQRKFIISLEGPWGSGKTTVLNIVKNKIKENNLDTIIIDDFDPWSFDDNSSMFRGMFDILLKKSGIKFSATQSKKIIDSLYGVLFTDEDRKKIRALGLYNEESFSEINKIKKMINNYLQLSNKKVVFIIDNIDRIEKENITLLFKLVNNILDFDYVTYILAFDGENMKNIMQDELKIDYDYLKKIVQLQVKLPNIQSDVKINIIDRCIKNILILYGEKEENLNEYDILINKLGVIIKDIRDLKRFINSVVSFNYRSNKYLNIIEIFIIELIKMYNNNLYNSIYNNSQFFISHDKIWLNSISSLINKQQFNKEGKAYFDNLFSDENNKEYQSILSEIFPYVKKYKCGEDLECTVNAIISNHEEYKSIEKKKSICSAKFFDLYFAQTDNDFIYISNAIDIFIELINNSDNKINIMDNLYLLIRKFPKETHKTVFETMQYYIGDIKVENLHYLAYALFSNIYEIEDAREFMGLSGRSRASMIISDILLLMPDIHFNKYIEDMENEYSKLIIIDSINYWMKCNKYVKSDIEKERLIKFNEKFIYIGKNIYDNNINIYKEFYNKDGVWALYRALKDIDRDIKVYIKNIIDSETIIRLIYDITIMSIGTFGYRYKISTENLNTLITVNEIDDLIHNRTSNTKDEEFVLEVYKYFREDIRDDWDEASLLCSNEISLNL